MEGVTLLTHGNDDSPRVSENIRTFTGMYRVEVDEEPNNILGDTVTADTVAEMKAFAIAAEAVGNFEQSKKWYSRELRMYMQLILSDIEKNESPSQHFILELLRCSECLGRCFEADEELQVIATHTYALHFAQLIYVHNHPVIAGIKVHLGDSHTENAFNFNQQLTQLVSSTEDNSFGGDEWRIQVRDTTANRDQSIRIACDCFTDAILIYEVYMCQCDSVSFKEHVSHALAKIAEGHALAGKNIVADKMAQRALETFYSFSESQELKLSGNQRSTQIQFSDILGTRNEKSSPNMRMSSLNSSVFDLCSHEEKTFISDVSESKALLEEWYDSLQPTSPNSHSVDKSDSSDGISEAIQVEEESDYKLLPVSDLLIEEEMNDLPHDTVLNWSPTAPYSDCELQLLDYSGGDRMRIETLFGNSAQDSNQVMFKYNTWIPTVDDIIDILESPKEIAFKTFVSASALIKLFCEAIRNNSSDKEWLQLLRRNPLLVCIGFNEKDDASLVLCSNQFSEALSEIITYPKLVEFDHLKIWSDMTPREIAKAHGKDWERKPSKIRYPLLEAIDSGNKEAASLLLELGADPRCCSPDDMSVGLQIAMEKSDWEIVQLLLSHPLVDIDYRPSYVLSANRVGALRETEISQLELSSIQTSGGINEIIEEMNFPHVWDLILSQSAARAHRYFESNKYNLLRRANDLSEESCKTVVTRGFKGLLWKKLHQTLLFSLQMKFDLLTKVLLTLFSESERIGILCTSDSIELVSRILIYDDSIDVNSFHEGKPIISYHLSRENNEIICYLASNHELSDNSLNEEEREKLGVITDKWGLSLT